MSKTVLVVDDEKNIRRTLQLVLEGEGYHVLASETAEQALAILANPDIPVDLALFDVKLPDMSGLEALERIRRDEAMKETPIIVITTEGSTEDRQRAMALGANAYITKPIQAPQVIQKVKELLKLE